MKKTRRSLIATLACAFVLVLSLGIVSACGTGESASADGAWYFGDNIPASELGQDGDYYLNTETLASYVKEGKAWRAANPDEGGKWYYGTDALDGTETFGNTHDFYLDTDDGVLYQKGETWKQVLTLKGKNGRDGVVWFSGDKDPNEYEEGDATLKDALKGDFYLKTDDFSVWQLVEKAAEGKPELEWTSLGSIAGIAGKGIESLKAEGKQLTVTYTDGTSETFDFACCFGAHTYGEEVTTIIEANCSSGGLVLKTCTVCGMSTVESVAINEDYHHYVDGFCEWCGRCQLEGHYRIEGDKCIVTVSRDSFIFNDTYKGEPVPLTIPSEIEGKKVEVEEAFYDEDSIDSDGNPFRSWVRDNFQFTGNEPHPDIHTLIIQEGVNVGMCAFIYTNIQHLILEGNASYGAGAFYGVTGLKDVKIKGKATLGVRIFAGADLTATYSHAEIESIDMSEAEIEVIPKCAFYKCYSLANVKLSKTLKEIGHLAFQGCVFEELVMPKSLERIYNMAFYYCRNIKKIVFQSVITKANRSMKVTGIAVSDTFNFSRCPSGMQICFTGTLEDWIAEEPEDVNGMQDMIYNGSASKYVYKYSYELTPEDLGVA